MRATAGFKRRACCHDIARNAGRRSLGGLGAALLFALASAPALADPGTHGPFMSRAHDWGGGMFAQWIMMLAVIGLIVFLVVGGLKWLSNTVDRDTASEHAPADILKRRLARGEIDVADYKERLSIVDK